MKEHYKEFKEGEQAYGMGGKLSENPYTYFDRPMSGVSKENNRKHDAWFRGFAHAWATDELNPRRKELDENNKADDSYNFAPAWLELAEKYKQIAYRANYEHCMYMYRKNMRTFNLPIPPEHIEFIPPVQPTRPENRRTYDWQKRKDT